MLKIINLKFPFKNQVILLLFLLYIAVIQGQSGLTTEQWQEDLSFIQEAIHNDYPFLFKKISSKEFDIKVRELHKVIPNMEEHEILIGFSRLIASFGYGHTELGWWENKVPLHNLPVVMYHYDDGVFVQGVHRDYENLLGAKVLEIEGTPTQKALELIKPAIPAENDQYLKNYGVIYLTFPEFLHAQGIMPKYKKEVRLKLEKNGKVFEQTVMASPLEFIPKNYGMVIPDDTWLESRDLSKTPLYLKELDKSYYYEYLPQHQTLYVRLSQIIDHEDESISEFFEYVFDYISKNDVQKLILDVRLNTGGDSYKNKPILTGVIRTDKINKVGKFMVIIGRRTFSACMNLVNDLHTHTNAVFVGEPTSENVNFFGDNRAVKLPNSGINAHLSYAWWQDKPQWENKDWLVPHIRTEMTFEQYRTNQDPALKAALEFSDNNFIINPIGHLMSLFFQDQHSELLSIGKQMIEDPVYNFVDFENELSVIGNRFIKNGALEVAKGILEINTELFPKSYKTWYELAEAHWHTGEKEKAKEYYQKTVSMQPNGQIMDNALNKLKEIRTP